MTRFRLSLLPALALALAACSNSEPAQEQMEEIPAAEMPAPPPPPVLDTTVITDTLPPAEGADTGAAQPRVPNVGGD